MMPGPTHGVIQHCARPLGLVQQEFGPSFTNLAIGIISDTTSEIGEIALVVIFNIGVHEKINNPSMVGPKSDGDISNYVATSKMLENLHN